MLRSRNASAVVVASLSTLAVLAGGCGFFTKRKSNIQSSPAGSPGPVPSASPQATAPVVPGAQDSVAGNKNPVPAEETLKPSPSPSPSPEPTFPTVTEGGAETGFLADRSVYFAGDATSFSYFQLETTATETKLIGEIHFKDAGPAEDLNSHLHSGTCAEPASPHYQNIKDDPTPGTSELHVKLSGTGKIKEGAGIGNFLIPADEAVSYVVHLPDGSKVCSDYTPPEPVTDEPDSVGSVVNPDGSVTFAPNDSILYKVKMLTSSTETTITGNIYFKTPPTETSYASHLHEGTCADGKSPHYQHIPGNATPGVSELHVSLEGDEKRKTGTTTVGFIARAVPLSYVIHYGTSRLCVDIKTK